MESPAASLSSELARNAEAVCRHYLGNGRRSGRYWLVGDVANTPGRSLFVRLTGPLSGQGAAGKWHDAATGEHGDLLDLIAANLRLSSLAEVLQEARAFLCMPDRPPPPSLQKPARNSVDAARRLWASAVPITGTLAETYLRKRGIAVDESLAALRFHPRCFWVSADGHSRRSLPAMLAAVTDHDGTITGLQRTWLSQDGSKADVDPQRRAMGRLLGNAVRFGDQGTTAIIAEGIETALSVRTLMPRSTVIAALSAANLEQFHFWPGLQCLMIAHDNDAAGRSAAEKLSERARTLGIIPYLLAPQLSDWNDDLQEFGTAHCGAWLAPHL
jgi:phage/plasmid primase-like uncharacterized protein